jgi:hypothetical protein
VASRQPAQGGFWVWSFKEGCSYWLQTLVELVSPQCCAQSVIKDAASAPPRFVRASNRSTALAFDKVPLAVAGGTKRTVVRERLDWTLTGAHRANPRGADRASLAERSRDGSLAHSPHPSATRARYAWIFVTARTEVTALWSVPSTIDHGFFTASRADTSR